MGCVERVCHEGVCEWGVLRGCETWPFHFEFGGYVADVLDRHVEDHRHPHIHIPTKYNNNLKQ